MVGSCAPGRQGQVWYLDRGNQENITAGHREKRGEYLIEASAFHLPNGSKWQPRLVMTRVGCGKALPKSQSFPGLAPLFETAKGAVRFATDLGRRMIDEESPRLMV
jgi:hypothetical protein